MIVKLVPAHTTNKEIHHTMYVPQLVVSALMQMNETVKYLTELFL